MENEKSVIAFVQVTDGDKHVSIETPVLASALDAVLFDFNPTANRNVTAIKALCAALITQMESIRYAGTPAQKRCASIAITELEGAQMRCVKALFAKA